MRVPYAGSRRAWQRMRVVGASLLGDIGKLLRVDSALKPRWTSVAGRRTRLAA